MSPALAGAALLACLSMVLALHPGVAHGGLGRRASPLDLTPADEGHPPESEARARAGPAPLKLRLASLVAGAAVWLLLGGTVGVVLGVGVALVLPVLIGRMEPAGVRRERLELIRSAPLVADLLCAALLAGVPLESAIPVVARAVGGSAGSALFDIHRRSALGEPMPQAWARLKNSPGLGGIARAVARSSRTGAPLAALLGQVAEELRADASAAALVRVRTTAVRAVLPLGLCLLPAFALLGIAPIIGGLLPAL